MLWHEQTWPQLQAIDKATPVVVPLGSIEQHGQHLPLLVDTLQVSAIAEGAERRLGGRALFLPTLWLGCSEHHRDFPGRVSVPASVFTAMIKGVAASIFDAGFSKLFFLNGHGGNEIPASLALTELVAERDDVDAGHVALASWWQVAARALSPETHGMSTSVITHACEYETSLTLALRPDLVHMASAQNNESALRTGWYDSSYGGRVRVFHRFARLTPTGSMGSPQSETPDKGRSILDAVVKEVAAFLDDFRAWPVLPSRAAGGTAKSSSHAAPTPLDEA